jgi:glutamate-1-semialdehyde 2,1-aminomutase
VPDSEGHSSSAAHNIIVLPFNDAGLLEKTVKKHGNELAAIFAEPIILSGGGLIPPKEGYLRELRRIADENGVVLVFDEVLSGFRLSRGGAQEYYGVIPDLTVMGKLCASGFPIGLVCGKNEIMELAGPQDGGARVPISGTFTANPISMIAAKATLTEINSNPTIYQTLSSSTEKVGNSIEQLIAQHNLKATVQAVPGAFQVFFTDRQIHNYRDVASSDSHAYELFYTEMIKRRILLWGGIAGPYKATCRQFLSIAHTEEDIHRTIEEIDDVFKLVRKIR